MVARSLAPRKSDKYNTQDYILLKSAVMHDRAFYVSRLRRLSEAHVALVLVPRLPIGHQGFTITTRLPALFPSPDIIWGIVTYHVRRRRELKSSPTSSRRRWGGTGMSVVLLPEAAFTVNPMLAAKPQRGEKWTSKKILTSQEVIYNRNSIFGERKDL